jgi:hypothetical protein
LFPFSLDERAKQWYTHNVGKVASDWEELRNKFCVAFFPISRIAALRQEILNFRQKEKETVGVAWDRFSILTRSGPDLSIPNHVLLQHFWLGLSKESALHLNITAGGSFTHKTTEEGEALLDCILENTPLEPLRVESMSNHEEVSLAEAEPTLSIQEPSPELEDPKEGLQSSDLPPFEDDLFEEFENTSNYLCQCQRRPPVPVTPLDPLDEEFLRESIRELTSIMSNEWVEEAEFSPEEIQIHAPSSTIQCKVGRSWENILYNPTVGANLVSTSYALAYVSNGPFAPTNRSLRLVPRSSMESLGFCMV